MYEDLIPDIYNKIIETNKLESVDAIPHSDVFLRNMESMYGIEIHNLKRLIRLLKESHKILSIEIVKEDKGKEIQRIEGYVDANLITIRKLKNFFQMLLMAEYEKQYHTRMFVNQIVKEIYSKAGMFKNTLIGQLANKAIMLEEYEHLLEKNFYEYTEEWKDNKLRELMTDNKEEIQEEDKELTSGDKSENNEQARRAVDTNIYNEFIDKEKKYSLDKMLQIYGIEFFIRVNLRKYNFNLLREIIEKGGIDNKSDLKLLKNMVQKMKQNFDKDIKLSEHTDEIYKLERAISRSILLSKK